jgi:hypothetical protein
VKGTSLPVDYHTVSKPKIYLDAKTDKQKRRATITKNDVYQQLPRQVVANQIPFRVEPYHKSLKQNASLSLSPTKTITNQTNHLFASLCA